MPNSIISHQAPALYLKMKFPKKIDGVAICIGSLVPDLNLFSLELRNVTHSLLGQIIWTVPLTLILTIICCRYIVSNLSRIAIKNGFIPKLLRYFGVDDWELVKTRKFDKKFFIVASYSALIGGLTHLLLDFPSHPTSELFYPWVIIPSFEFLGFPLIIFGYVTIISVLVWIIEDIILFITSLYLFRLIKKKGLIRSWNS